MRQCTLACHTRPNRGKTASPKVGSAPTSINKRAERTMRSEPPTGSDRFKISSETVMALSICHRRKRCYEIYHTTVFWQVIIGDVKSHLDFDFVCSLTRSERVCRSSLHVLAERKLSVIHHRSEPDLDFLHVRSQIACYICMSQTQVATFCMSQA